MKKTKLTRSLLAACSIVALTAVMYGCSSGISQSEADRQAAEAAAAAEQEAAAAAAAAEQERQARIDAAEAAINAATTVEAAQAAYDMVDLTMATGDEALRLQMALSQRIAALTPPEPEPMEYAVTLPAGHGLNPGMTMIPAGTTVMLASGTHITCEGDADCTLTIGIESVTGALSASSTGGTVSVSTEATRLAAVHMANQQTLADAREALADLEAMDPGDVTANDLAAAQMAVADALKLPGNEDAPENQPDPEPEPEPSVAVAVADFMYLDDENKPSAGTHEIAAGDTATNNGVIYACAEGGEDCTVTVAADGTATSTGGTVAASLSADAVLQVAQAKKTAKDKADAAAEVMRDRIIGKDRAIEAAANLGLTATAGLDEDEIMISRAAGAMASVASTGYSDSMMPILPNAGWSASRLMQTVTGATNHLFVYTDIEAPTRIQFYNWDGDPDTPRLYANTEADALTEPADAGFAIGGLTLTGGAAGNFSASTADRTKFPQPQTPKEGSLLQNYPNNEDTDNDLTNGFEQVSIPGNYNGAGGRYVCTGGTADAPCSVTVAPDGTYTLVGTTWTFVPELNSTAWQGDQEFMSFGWWLQEPTAADGAYGFRYYADGNAYTLPADATLATGSATYNGRAAGKYVVQTIDDGGVTGGNAGMFTAAASLTAMFGATNTIGGTINGFQTDNADVNVSGWSVTLARQAAAVTAGTETPVYSSSNNDPDAANFDGATGMLGDQAVLGTWTAQFFGQPATADAYPLGIGGTFQADNEQASIAGAFGARR